MARKHTTKSQDAAFLARLMAQATKRRAVGDMVQSWGGKPPSRIARIDGELVTLEDGVTMHISKVRDA